MDANKVRIKTEPGTSAAGLATQRLPSLKPPRDLSLSSFGQGRLPPNLVQTKNKKVYIPNLNVQRKKPTEDVPVKQENAKPKEKFTGEERGRGRGRKYNFVQMSSGVFAEGLASGMRNSRSWGSGGSGEKKDNFLQKPRLKLEHEIKVNKEEEENTVKELLRDDFIDDPSLEPDFENCPVKLPLKDWKVFNVDQGDKPKNKPDMEVKVKQEPGIYDEKQQVQPKEEKSCKMKMTLPDVVNSLRNESQYMFLQLPSCMPGLKPEGETARPPATKSTVAAQSANTSTSENPGSKPLDRCLLSTLSPGLIGRLQILKSGRCRLQLGDSKMWLELGTQVAFRQDLMSVELNPTTKTGNMVTLGPVSTRMSVLPDWEEMLTAKTAV